MIVFQVSLNFEPVKEILTIRCHIYILMKKVIILRKTHMTMKSLKTMKGWDLRTLAQFQGNEMSSGLFQDLMDGYIKP